MTRTGDTAYSSRTRQGGCCPNGTTLKSLCAGRAKLNHPDLHRYKRHSQTLASKSSHLDTLTPMTPSPSRCALGAGGSERAPTLRRPTRAGRWQSRSDRRYSCRSGRTSWSATAFSRTHLGSERSRWWKTYVLDANRRPADEPTEVCGDALRRPHRAGGRLIAGGSEPPALVRFQQPPQRQNHYLPRPSPTTPAPHLLDQRRHAPQPHRHRQSLRKQKKPREQGRPPRTDSNLVRAQPNEHIWRHLRDQ